MPKQLPDILIARIHGRKVHHIFNRSDWGRDDKYYLIHGCIGHGFRYDELKQHRTKWSDITCEGCLYQLKISPFTLGD